MTGSDWLAECPRCHFRRWASDFRKEWTGQRVCRDCFDPKHPQLSVRGVVDKQTPPWVRPPPTDALLSIASVLGLTTGLKLCLDGSNVRSYPGTGQKWLDVSGGGYDFYLGADSTASATDPTYVGTEGFTGDPGTSQYFSFDGGDYLTYDAANETWMSELHKDAAKVSACAWVMPGSVSTIQSIFGTSGGGNSNVGFELLIDATARVNPVVRNATGSTSMSQADTAHLLVAGQWNFVGVSIDEAVGTDGIIYCTNGLLANDVSTYTSPSSAAATHTMQVGARGNASSPLVSGSRLGLLCVWQGVALTFGQMHSVFYATRGRFRSQ